MTIQKIELSEENKHEILTKEHSFVEFEYLATSHQEEVRCLVAKNPFLPQIYAEMMVNDIYPSVRAALAENQNLVRTIIDLLVLDNHILVLKEIAKHPNLAEHQITTFSKHRSFFVRNAVATNPSISPQLLDELSRDKEWGVRRSVAANPRTTREILERLANDEVSEVLYEIVNNFKTETQLLLYFFEKTVRDKKVNDNWREKFFFEKLVEHHNFPEEKAMYAFVHAATELEITFDESVVAKRENLSEKAIEIIIVHENEMVRAALASNLALQEVHLAKLALDESESVRTAVYNNPNTSSESKATALLLGIEKNDDND